MSHTGQFASRCVLPTGPVLALLVGLACAPLGAVAQTNLNRVLFDPQPLAAAPLPTAAVPYAAAAPLASPAAPDVGAEDIQQYLDAIAAEELDGGPYAPELPERLLALGKLYQQQGDHEAALAVFAKADHISRINSGLYAPQQFAIVEHMITSHLARGELGEAHAQQQYLLLLKRQYYGADSLDLVPALETLANWNLDAFRATLNQHTSVDFTPALSARRRINEPAPRLLAFGNLYQAQYQFYQAIQNMTEHRRYSDPRLLELERKLVETVFYAANREGILNNPDFYLDRRSLYTGTRVARSMRGASLHFINGRNAYQRMRLYQEASAGTDPVAVAQTIIALGDWYLLFEHPGTALKLYREAYRYLTEHQVGETTITALLTPALPRQLPAFTPLPHSRGKFGIAADAALEYEGYFDVRVRLSRFGKVRAVEMLASTGPASPQLERRLRRLLHSAPFRPRFGAGEPLQSDVINLRYYYAQMPEPAALNR